jgi:hypothetical protein
MAEELADGETNNIRGVCNLITGNISMLDWVFRYLLVLGRLKNTPEKAKHVC